MKENILSNYTVKKVYFSYNKITTTKKTTTIYEKKPHGSLYVAYVQESPETANPSISSLRVSCLLSINFPFTPIIFNLHLPFYR